MIRSLKASLAVLTAIAALASSVRADFEIEVVTGGDTIIAPTSGPYTPNGPGTNPSPATSINVNVDSLNADLAAAGAGFTFTSLSATTNEVTMGGVVTEQLSVGGLVTRTSAGGPDSLMIFVTNTDYTIPTGLAKVLGSNSSATISPNGGTISDQFQSFYGPSNTNYDMTSASPTTTLTAPGSSGANATPTTVFGPTPYSLTNATTLSLTSTPNAPQIIFGGTTTITASTVVPEPASMTLLFLGAPLAFRAIRRRKTAA